MKSKYKTLYEHRVIAEKKIGRKLRKGEVVHHLDGDSTNNEAWNLEVCSSAYVHSQHHRNSIKKIEPLVKVGELYF